MPNPENIEPHKYPKGVSGNPAGRPKGAKNRSTTARRWLEVDQKAKNPLTGVEEIMSQEDLITLAQIKRARQGDVNAYKALMDSAYNMPKQTIDQNNTHTINDFDIKKLVNFDNPKSQV